MLKADRNQPDGSGCDTDIKAALNLSVRTVEQVRQRFVEEGLAVALRCSDAPSGQGRWTLQLWADRMVELNDVEHISHESVRPVLKKPNCNLGSKRVG